MRNHAVHGLLAAHARSLRLQHSVGTRNSARAQVTDSAAFKSAGKFASTLGNLDAKSVTVFLDTCFSGQTREKKSLLADARGIMVVPLEKNVPSTVTVISAATAGQISGPLKDKEHGLFTYYVLKGMGGAADINRDKKLTVSELASYVQAKVKEQAAENGWNQTPELQGTSDRILVKF